MNKEDWWKPAMFFYAKVTSWIIFPVFLALFLHKILNKEGNQFIFFILIFISFCLTCFGIYKEIKIYNKEIIQKSLNNKKDGN